MPTMLPRLEITQTLRPVDLVSAAAPTRSSASPGTSTLLALPRPAPYAAVTVALRHRPHRTDLGFTSGATRLAGWYDGSTGRVGIDVTDGERPTSTHRSRRHGTVETRPTGLGVTLTGPRLTVLVEEDGRWTARAWVDLSDRIDTRDERWLAGLRTGHRADTGAVTAVRAGGFGQLGMRDIRWVTHADGSLVRDGRAAWLSATSAGPGFFDTAHTSVWRVEGLDGDLSVTHSADLWFRRPDRPGVYGDNATHLVRHGDGWLVATSTWGDFDADDPDRHVGVTLAETDTDVLRGEHVLDTRRLALPTDGLDSVGVWDPHLVRTGGEWLVGYVSARRYFSFHPCLASGPNLDSLGMVGAATERTATEGTTLAEVDGEWLVVASDGRDGPRGTRKAYPVWDSAMRSRGALAAPYPSNIPWPGLARVDGTWLMVTFDGTPAGGKLPGYGTHGDLVVMREV